MTATKKAAPRSEAEPPGALVASSAFENYTLGRKLGEGGCSEVFEAVDEGGQRVAVKVLKPDLPSSKRKRLKNELGFLAQSRHANIVVVQDSGEILLAGKRRPFLVMPLYEKTFRGVMNERLPSGEKLSLYLKVLDGVEAAHLLNVWHRDLKPENVLWMPTSGAIAVADFGIARFSEDFLETAIETKAADRLANFIYAAPEQKRKGGQVDQRADIFALGLILEELFTGAVPLAEGYPRIASVAPEFAYLDEIAARMIRFDAAERPGSLAEVKREIAALGRIAIAQQALDSEKRRVVRQEDLPLLSPIEATDWDWDRGELIATLNEPPPRDWREVFSNEQFPYSSFMGQGPATASLNQKQISLRCRENEAVQQKGFVSGWIRGANEATLRQRQQEAQERARAQQAADNEAREQAEARIRVLSRLKG